MSFKFVSLEKTIEIDGHEFAIKVGDVETLERLDAVREAFQKELSEVVVGPNGPYVTKFCRLVADQLDIVLGDGAYETLFAGRPLNFVEHTNLYNYVLEKLSEMGAERKNLIMGAHKEAEIVAKE
jgi:hypothetical protein